MALACLACHSLENATDSFRMAGSFRSQNLSVSSVQSDDGCGTACFSKKQSPATRRNNKHLPGVPSPGSASPKPVSIFGRRAGVPLDRMVFPEPRLTRCHAIRRDLFSNWIVGEVEGDYEA